MKRTTTGLPDITLASLCSGHSLLDLDNTIYIIGGTNDKSVLSEVEALDVQSGTRASSWTQELGMLSPRSEHAGATMDGRIWVSGGFDGDDILRCCDFFP